MAGNSNATVTATQTTNVTLNVNVAKNSVVVTPGSDMQAKLAAAATSGGDAVSEYFKWKSDQTAQIQTLLQYVADKGTDAFEASHDGDGNPIYVVNPPA